MVPDSDLQLQMVIKALQEAVAPGLKLDEKIAAEQLHLSIATLGMVRQHLPITRRFIRAMSRDALDLAARLDAVVATETLKAPTAALEAALADPAIENQDIEEARAALHGAISALIDGLDAADRPAVRAIVVDAMALPIERQRAWFLGSGFEADPGIIRQIGELIG
ncbi:hypothetical protein ACFSTD_19890 [Novosphingobium colocasiae]|uniref:Uncharacterized protein n=1 Tax=Novosphingobium colocasiae TaxID=1256513 RepID=A0A918UC45_9SPHN|nr:hypothetical protein [Novosphingobium colocasiae]GGY90163.1 hypothetical protein GCM10011614_01040 [Novosphingobium colocasiae]